jgi:hypothetical protein
MSVSTKKAGEAMYGYYGGFLRPNGLAAAADDAHVSPAPSGPVFVVVPSLCSLEFTPAP